MSRLLRPALSIAATLALAGALAAPSATAAPGPIPEARGPAGEAPVVAGKGDSDGDKLADDLEAALADLRPGDRVGVIVQGATPGQARGAAPSFQVSHEYTIIPAFAGSVTAGQVTALAAIPWVTRVELDGVATAFDAAGDRDYGVDAARSATPSLASDGALDGDGVGICIIDTGIDPNHEQLSGRIVGWKDWVNNRTTPYDDHGHGTHVAGIAAGDATGGANAPSYGGVARAADLIGAKVLSSSGSGSDANVVAAIDWCAQREDVQIISMSLGSPGGDGSDAGSQAANSAVLEHGKVVVVAAGNSGDGETTIASPGVATQVVTVGAASDYSVPAGQAGHDAGLTLAGFSSRGPTANPSAPLKPDLVAPGTTVMSAKSGTTSQYVAYSGTSMATPFVAGVVALGLDVVPDAPPGQVKAALQASAHDAGAAGPDNDWGHGLVDARAFIDHLRGAASPATASWPAHALIPGSVPSNGSTDIPIDVTASGQPLGISLRLDGSQGCLLPVGDECWWPLEWSPDLDAVLLDPNGTQAAESQCALTTTTGFCGTVGRWETLGAASAVEGTWILRVAPFSGDGGTFEADVFGAIGGDVANRAPTADAGLDQEVATGAAVELAGTASDPDGDSLTYAWTQTGGTAVTLHGATSLTPTFTAPSEATTLTFRLSVSDGELSDTDDVMVTVSAPPAENQPPVADAGLNQTVDRRTPFTLDGGGSYDPEGGALTYTWYLGRKVVGTTVKVTESKNRGTYEYRLVVTDPEGATDDDTVTVTVR